VLLEGLGKLKKIIHLIGSRTRYLQACSIIKFIGSNSGIADGGFMVYTIEMACVA
jgi:hypothetical protein